MEYLPDSNTRYKDVDYWNERYRTEESFEWFGDFTKFEHLLKQHVGTEENVLMLGCGNSALSYDMYQAGYTSITNVDYSSVCVESMAERYKDCAQLSWLCMDARRLAFPDGVFDVVLEKGTLDAMLVEETDPWKVSEKAAQLLHQVLLECPWCSGEHCILQSQKCALGEVFAVTLASADSCNVTADSLSIQQEKKHTKSQKPESNEKSF
ncbi:EEF1A lysine methyltransferase 4 isoform X3 [Chanodichthys erythropterus]|uniref:EEF1A lysine methyltransferase 4 isoform X3 n=1 Tax=Chanodichthys erythropterus TaxID=933992 RepID=UPI00351F1537